LNFSDIPEGTNIFVDSNILLYIFLRHHLFHASCHTLIQRIENSEINGYCNDFVFNEVIHKLMITAFVNFYHCSPYGAVSLIKRKPEILNEFPELWQAGELLQALGFTIISGPFFPDAVNLAEDYHLLITDAVHVAAMKKEGITHIATNDVDFERIPFLEISKPHREGTG